MTSIDTTGISDYHAWKEFSNYER